MGQESAALPLEALMRALATSPEENRGAIRIAHPARLCRLMGDDVSLNAAWHELSDPRDRPTPQVTIEAVMQAVRERGLVALKEPATAQRLECCDEVARAEIERRIANLRKD
jgi:hypothetical protein